MGIYRPIGLYGFGDKAKNQAKFQTPDPVTTTTTRTLGPGLTLGNVNITPELGQAYLTGYGNTQQGGQQLYSPTTGNAFISNYGTAGWQAPTTGQAGYAVAPIADISAERAAELGLARGQNEQWVKSWTQEELDAYNQYFNSPAGLASIERASQRPQTLGTLATPPPANTPPPDTLTPAPDTLAPPAGTELGQSANGVPYVGSFTGAGGKKTFMDANGIFYDQDTGQPFGQIDKNTGMVWGTGGKFQGKLLGYVKDGVMYDTNGNVQNFDSGGQFDLKTLGSLNAGDASGGVISTGDESGGADLNALNYTDPNTAALWSMLQPNMLAQYQILGTLQSPEYLNQVLQPQLNAIKTEAGMRGLSGGPNSYTTDRTNEAILNTWAGLQPTVLGGYQQMTPQTLGYADMMWKPENEALDLLVKSYLDI